MGRRHDPQLPLGGHRCELITVTSFLVDVHSSPSALSSFLARRSQDHTCRKAVVNDKGRLRNNPQSKIEKNKVARLVVMPERTPVGDGYEPENTQECRTQQPR